MLNKSRNPNSLPHLIKQAMHSDARPFTFSVFFPCLSCPSHKLFSPATESSSSLNPHPMPPANATFVQASPHHFQNPNNRTHCRANSHPDSIFQKHFVVYIMKQNVTLLRDEEKKVRSVINGLDTSCVYFSLCGLQLILFENNSGAWFSLVYRT